MTTTIVEHKDGSSTTIDTGKDGITTVTTEDKDGNLTGPAGQYGSDKSHKEVVDKYYDEENGDRRHRGS
ncbi:hypothetical protein [Pantoea sp.]|uniref:hypothetical protein n=1 Tax=Pantoea sp. TaxID=69393 RepID=UPI0028AFD76C|nr:hypothetical protein [Pantoea sp.]